MSLFRRLIERESGTRSTAAARDIECGWIHSILGSPPVRVDPPPPPERVVSDVATGAGTSASSRAYAVGGALDTVSVMKAHFGCVNALSISHGAGRWIATGSDDARVLVWDAFAPVSETGATAKPIAAFRGHIRNIFCTAFSIDNRKIFSCGIDETIRMFDLESAIDRASSRVGNSAARAASVGTVTEIDTAGRSERVFSEHARSVHRVCTVTDSVHTFLSASSDHTVRVWDSRVEAACATIRFRAGMNSVASCPVNPHLFATGGDRLFISDLRRLPPPPPASDSGSNGAAAALAAHRRQVTILPALCQYYTGIREVGSIDWSHDGQRMVCCIQKSYPLVFDVTGGSGAAGAALPGLTSATSYVDELQSGISARAVAAGTDARGAPPSWHALNKVPLVYASHRLTGKEYRNICTMRAAAFIGPDSSHVACGSDTFQICIWDVSSPAQRTRAESFRHSPLATGLSSVQLPSFARHAWRDEPPALDTKTTAAAEVGDEKAVPSAAASAIAKAAAVQSRMDQYRERRAAAVAAATTPARAEFGSKSGTVNVLPCSLLSGHRSIPNHVAWHPTLNRLYSGGVEKCVRVWGIPHFATDSHSQAQSAPTPIASASGLPPPAATAAAPGSGKRFVWGDITAARHRATEAELARLRALRAERLRAQQAIDNERRRQTREEQTLTKRTASGLSTNAKASASPALTPSSPADAKSRDRKFSSPDPSPLFAAARAAHPPPLAAPLPLPAAAAIKREVELEPRTVLSASEVFLMLTNGAGSDRDSDDSDNSNSEDDDSADDSAAGWMDRDSDGDEGENEPTARTRRRARAAAAAAADDGDTPEWFEVDETDGDAVLARAHAFGHSGGLTDELQPAVVRRIARSYARYQNTHLILMSRETAEAALATASDTTAGSTGAAAASTTATASASAVRTNLVADAVRVSRLPDLITQFGADAMTELAPASTARAGGSGLESKTAAAPATEEKKAGAAAAGGTTLTAAERRQRRDFSIDEDMKVLAQFDYLLASAARERILTLEEDDGEDMDFSGGGSDDDDDADANADPQTDESTQIGGEPNQFLQSGTSASSSGTDAEARRVAAAQARRQFERRRRASGSEQESDESSEGDSDSDDDSSDRKRTASAAAVNRRRARAAAASASGSAASATASSTGSGGGGGRSGWSANDFQSLLQTIDSRISARTGSGATSQSTASSATSSDGGSSLRAAFASARDDAAGFMFGDMTASASDESTTTTTTTGAASGAGAAAAAAESDDDMKSDSAPQPPASSRTRKKKK